MSLDGVFEVHSVQVSIKKIVGASKEVYGHIVVDDGGKDGLMTIFNADKEHAQALSTDGLLPLSGPHRCILSYNCCIALVLYEKHSGLEVSKGYIDFWKMDCPIDMNRPITHLLHSDYGFTRVHVSLFEYSIQALVEMVFVPLVSLKPRQYTIFGEVSAQYSSYEYNSIMFEKYHKTRLFEFPKKKAMEISTVPRDGAKIVKIPLVRPAICVPYDNWLGIDTTLWVTDSEIKSQDSASQIMSGTALFFCTKDLNGKTTEYIEGNFGRIEVSVTWLAGVYEK